MGGSSSPKKRKEGRATCHCTSLGWALGPESGRIWVWTMGFAQARRASQPAQDGARSCCYQVLDPLVEGQGFVCRTPTSHRQSKEHPDTRSQRGSLGKYSSYRALSRACTAPVNPRFNRCGFKDIGRVGGSKHCKSQQRQGARDPHPTPLGPKVLWHSDVFRV